MNVVDEVELVKLLDVKDMENGSKKEHYEADVIENDIETIEVVKNGSIGSNSSCVERRSDEPAELSFAKGDEICAMQLSFILLCFVFMNGRLTHSKKSWLVFINNYENNIAWTHRMSTIAFSVVYCVVVFVTYNSRCNDSAETHCARLFMCVIEFVYLCYFSARKYWWKIETW